ncbi:MAG: hypothetical protein ACRD2T_13930, partial [Thermoanaerobaculia bacterium]
DKKGLLDLVRWNELAVAGSRFKLYGFLRLDAIYDDSRPNNTQVIAWVRSEDPEAISRFRADPTVFGGVNPERFANRENQDDLTIHPRLTRLGIDFDGPVVRPLGEAKVTGKLEIDFYNNGLLGQAESRAAIRMRHAYLKLAWGGLSLLAGQTSDVISPTFPVVNPDLVMWGAGNLGDRRPQLRPEYIRTLGPGQVILQGEVGLSGADDNQDLDSPNTFGSGIRDGEASGLPTLQGRVAYRLTHAERRDLEVGLWAHRAWEETDTRFDRETHFDSTAYGLDATLPLYRKLLWLKGEGWYGENVDDVRGGIFQGINTTTGDEIISRGGFAEMGFQALSWYQVSIGYSTDDPENSDAGSGGRAANRIAYFSNRWFFDPIEIGLDYLYWKTDFVRFDSGDDNRFQAYISYKF